MSHRTLPWHMWKVSTELKNICEPSDWWSRQCNFWGIQLFDFVVIIFKLRPPPRRIHGWHKNHSAVVSRGARNAKISSNVRLFVPLAYVCMDHHMQPNLGLFYPYQESNMSWSPLGFASSFIPTSYHYMNVGSPKLILGSTQVIRTTIRCQSIHLKSTYESPQGRPLQNWWVNFSVQLIYGTQENMLENRVSLT